MAKRLIHGNSDVINGSSPYFAISNRIDRDFKIIHTIAFCGGQFSGSNVDLDRGPDQSRHVQPGVPFLPDGDEGSLILVVAYVNVELSLLADRSRPACRSTVRRVVVAHEEASLFRKRE